MSSKIAVASTNSCDAIRELIPEYAFGLTDPEQTRFVEANLQLCTDAAADLVDRGSALDFACAGVCCGGGGAGDCSVFDRARLYDLFPAAGLGGAD